MGLMFVYMDYGVYIEVYDRAILHISMHIIYTNK